MAFAQLAARIGQLIAPPAQPTFEPRRARGVADRSNPGIRTIVVRVDNATFDRIGAAAEASGVSTTEAIRQLIQRGLDSKAGA